MIRLSHRKAGNRCVFYRKFKCCPLNDLSVSTVMTGTIIHYKTWELYVLFSDSLLVHQEECGKCTVDCMRMCFFRCHSKIIMYWVVVIVLFVYIVCYLLARHKIEPWCAIVSYRKTIMHINHNRFSHKLPGHLSKKSVNLVIIFIVFFFLKRRCSLPLNAIPKGNWNTPPIKITIQSIANNLNTYIADLCNIKCIAEPLHRSYTVFRPVTVQCKCLCYNY